MLKYILLAAVIAANVIISLYFMALGEKELDKTFRHHHYLTSILSALTALTTFIAAVLP